MGLLVAAVVLVHFVTVSTDLHAAPATGMGFALIIEMEHAGGIGAFVEIL